jgi:hypothetical protein
MSIISESVTNSDVSFLFFLVSKGKEDPWIFPMWGQRIKQWLPHAHYYEISPSGHCPHHETSTAVNELLSSWVRSIEVRTCPCAWLKSHSLIWRLCVLCCATDAHACTAALYA